VILDLILLFLREKRFSASRGDALYGRRVFGVLGYFLDVSGTFVGVGKWPGSM